MAPNFINSTGWTTSSGGNSTTSTVTYTGGSTSTMPVVYANGTAISVCTDSNSYDQRSIRDRAADGDIQLVDFGGLLKLAKGAGKIVLPDKSEVVLDDYGNCRFRAAHDQFHMVIPSKMRQGQCLMMPDGAIIRMGYNGQYAIEDKDAKVTYRGNAQREFNKYVNASELLGDFVGALGGVGVTQDKVLKTPIEYFINWLIHRAAEQDDDDYAAKDVPTLIESKPVLITKKPRCKCCGCFISNKRAKLGINFCNPDHMFKYEVKHGV